MKRHDFIYRMDLPHQVVPTIARKLKLFPITVRQAVKDLRKVGLIRTEQRYRDSGARAAFYMFCSDKNHLPPRGNSAFMVAGGTSHDGRRM